MSRKRKSDEVDPPKIEDVNLCGDAMDIYKSVMNTCAIKTDIVQALIQGKENWDDVFYIGSYMTFPNDSRSSELKDYYVDEYDYFPGVKKAVNECLDGVFTSERCFIYTKDRK